MLPMPEGTQLEPAPAEPKAKAKAKKKVKIAHQMPGRIRMQIPSAKGNPEQLEGYRQTLSLIPGIEQIQLKPETGSIVLLYDPKLHDEFHARFADHCREQHDHRHSPPTNEIDALANKIAEEAEYLAEHSELARAIVDFCKKTDRQIKLSSHNMVDFKMLLAIGVVGYTIFEVGAAAATPVWVTLTLFGMNHFIEMHLQQQEPEAATVKAMA